MSEFAIRNQLYDAVLLGEGKKMKGQKVHGIEEFLMDFNLGESVKIGSVVQEAIDKRILSFDRGSGEWKLIVDKSQMPLSLMMVSPSDVPHARVKLTDYLLKNKYDFDVLVKTLSGDTIIKYGQVYDKEEIVASCPVTLENVDEAPYNDLQKAGSVLGIEGGIAQKKEVLRQMVKERLEEMAHTT
jgi:hypothetical protein